MSDFISLTFILILIIHLIYFILHLLLRLVLYLLLCLVLYLILSFQVCRVFLGSFWEAPLRLEDNRWGKDVKREREREREWRTEIVCMCSRERVCARQSAWEVEADCALERESDREEGCPRVIPRPSFFQRWSLYSVSHYFYYFCRQLLEREKQDLLTEMMALPQNAVVRRINELVKRARSVKVCDFTRWKSALFISL